MIKVTVVIPAGGFAATALAPLEVFFSTGVVWNDCVGKAPNPQFAVEAVSISAEPVECAYPVRISPSRSIDEVTETDIVFLPTVGIDIDTMIDRHAALLPWLQAIHANGAAIAAVCSGVAFPAASGLLDGHRATTHWALVENYRERFPDVCWQPESMVTEDDGLFCGGGVYAATDLALYLVQRYCGHEIAVQTSRALVIDMPRTYQSAYAVVPLSAPHHDEPIRQVEELIQARFATALHIEELAREIGMSPRTLIRRFKRATGKMPGNYLRVFRVSVARNLLETSKDTVQSVSSAVGYSDLTFFRRLFKRHTGMTPTEYRARFRTT